MKKSYFFILIAVFFISGNVYSQYTNIPDISFETALVNQGIDSEGTIDGQVLTSDISSLTTLNVSNSNIGSLSGIQDFTSLTYLNCFNNFLIGLDLSNNVALTDLICGGNDIQNLNIENNTALTLLEFGGNELYELNLDNHSQLTYLGCSGNYLTQLSVKNGNNTNFTYFNSIGNPNLNCIKVDDVAWSAANWTDIDSQSFFSNTCYTPITNANIHDAVNLWVSDQATAENTYGNISDWDTSNVTDMSFLFEDKRDFNENLSNWDVSNVTNMSNMFALMFNIFDANITNWDVSSVTDMSYMFYGNYAFNEDISNWEVSNVTDMSYMFSGNDGGVFNQPIGGWDVSSVTDMSYMFYESLFNHDISNWVVSSVTDMSRMFGFSPFNQDISNWDVSSVADMSHMFSFTPFNQDISSWDVSSVTDMTDMFFFNSSFSENNAQAIENYNALLIGWASLSSLQPNISLDLGTTTYCEGEAAKDYIISTYGWSFTDGGLDCPPVVNCLTVNNGDAYIGLENNLSITLESSEIIKGFQFDLTFPVGFVFNPSDIVNAGLPENFQLSCANVGGNTYRTIGFSLSSETIPAGTTTIISFPTNINEGTQTGDYTLPVTNVTLSDIDNVDIATSCTEDGIITLYDYPVGDSNGDDNVNILDILSTIDYIFGNPPSTFYFELADVNNDETINILDVLSIQDIILGSTRISNNRDTTTNNSRLAGDNYFIIDDYMVSANTSETIQINLENEDIVKGFQFDFVLPEGFTLNAMDIAANSRLNGFNVSAQETSPNTFRVIAFSLSSATIAAGTGAILDVPLFVEPDANIGDYPISFTGVTISDTNNADISTVPPSVGEISINTLGFENEENQKNTFTLYPNPTQNDIFVKALDEANYTIIDMLGKIVEKGVISEGKNFIQLVNYESGVYFLHFKNESGLIVKKIIKE